MRERDPSIVTVSEIADWAWCPEAWRLRSLEHAPGNRAALQNGIDQVVGPRASGGLEGTVEISIELEGGGSTVAVVSVSVIPTLFRRPRQNSTTAEPLFSVKPLA